LPEAGVQCRMRRYAFAFCLNTWIRRIALLLSLRFHAFARAEAAWQAAPGRLTTRWAKDVSPTKVHRIPARK